MADIALITEGITDQIVIRNILYGYLGDPDIVINPLQPLVDETDKSRMTGGWSEVMRYCSSQNFKEAFQFNAIVIIQIDTDVAQDFGMSAQGNDGTPLTDAALAERVVAHLAGKIGVEFYEAVKERIVFAISVDSIECWFLPVYYTDKRRSKTVNCPDTLNQALSRKRGFTIDAKRPDYYREISKDFNKRETVLKAARHQTSLKIFLDQLDRVKDRL